MSSTSPSRGDVWVADLDPVRGHEQGGRRPAVVLSVDLFNHGPAGMVVVAPLTSRDRGVPFQVEVTPPEGGLRRVSFIKCEDVRSIATGRLDHRLGRLSPQTMAAVEDRLRILLGL